MHDITCNIIILVVQPELCAYWSHIPVCIRHIYDYVIGDWTNFGSCGKSQSPVCIKETLIHQQKNFIGTKTFHYHWLFPIWTWLLLYRASRLHYIAVSGYSYTVTAEVFLYT